MTRRRKRRVIDKKKLKKGSQLVSWCFEPSQPQRITSGLQKRKKEKKKGRQRGGEYLTRKKRKTRIELRRRRKILEEAEEESI